MIEASALLENFFTYTWYNFRKTEIGMEYYDSNGSRMLYTYYLQKNNSILRNPEIIDILENYDNKKLDKVDVFQESPYVLIEKKRETCNYIFKKNSLLDERSIGSIISNIHKIVRLTNIENT